ncbi:F-box domain-containing protein [Heracleum sosnowskyi]|uniref:F-box domain-containing protein n=1 Tax=Heracleum sosnowskyi TaxID=360622 RepID=A0AAD8GUF8_9APIA|nr:F-box domain-containing protein [Heracleum sosnowskyi]
MYELIDQILYRVPVYYLLLCPCVSKELCSIIDSNAFIKKHSKRTIQCNLHSGVVISGDGNVFLTDIEGLRDDNVDAVELNDGFVSGAEFVGVANGLVCGCKENKKDLWCVIRQTRKLPRVFGREFEGVEVPLCGFGYDRVNDDYMVVKIGECEDCTVVIVYSLKTESWNRFRILGVMFILFRIVQWL